MKYDEKEFERSAAYYKKNLGRHAKGKNVLIVLGPENEIGFYSLAPLSRALHDIGADVNARIGKKKENRILMERLWKTCSEMRGGKKNRKTRALKEFISAAEKKIKKGEFAKIFREPEIRITGGKKGLTASLGEKEIFLEYRAKWHRKFKWKELLRTSAKILKYGYALKKSERFTIGFELVPAKKDIEQPLEDYLDNYSIARAMLLAAQKKCRSASLGAATLRKSKLERMERVSDLSATISGCEYSKKSGEKVFRKYASLCRALSLHEWKYSDAVFSIVGKGYGGKHLFGAMVGYPSPNGKTRWNSPGQMMLKPWWLMQTSLDKRMPKTRLGITETVPIKEFIETCNIDYAKMRSRNEKIKKAIEESEILHVHGTKVKGGVTKLKVELKKGRKRRHVQKSDSDARSKLDRRALERSGVKAGMYANFPGGEAFLTPESVSGTAIGDVVINLDRSIPLSAENPIVVSFRKGKWKLERGPAVVKEKIRKELRDAKKLLRIYEKNRSLPKKIVNSYRKNFRMTGEFAINTNPKAKPSRYLIISEKIANMIHIALGSGFEPDRNTMYHWDFVINAPRQKLDIYGMDRHGRKKFILRKGKFAL